MAVLRYQIDTSIDELHVLGMLLDPFMKFEIVNVPFITIAQVSKFLKLKTYFSHKSCLKIMSRTTTPSQISIFLTSTLQVRLKNAEHKMWI